MENKYTRAETLDRLERVISGIEKGELEHDQTTVHCGTAHCIAGWLHVMDIKDELGELTHDLRKIYSHAARCGVDTTLEYVDRYYDLSTREAYSMLFDEDLTIQQIRENFELIKERRMV